MYISVSISKYNFLVGNRSSASTCSLSDTNSEDRGLRPSFQFPLSEPFYVSDLLFSLTCFSLYFSLSLSLPSPSLFFLSVALLLCSLTLSALSSLVVSLCLSVCTALTVSRGSCLHSFMPQSSCSVLQATSLRAFYFNRILINTLYDRT